MKKLFAKLHLWLSIPFGIIISILCLTGAILVFEAEIKELCNPSMYKASMSRETPLPIEELMPVVKQQLPDSVSVSSVQIPAGPKDNYRMGITGQGRTSLLVDPYTGEVKGKVVPYEKGSFFTFVRRLHRWFILQNSREGISWGKMVTGTSTLVFFFILLTGLIVWIPKTLKGLKRKLSIKTGKGSFRFWYDTHLAGGIYVIIFLLAMCLTGLTWSFNWYRTGFYKVFGVEVTQNSGHGAPQAQQVTHNHQRESQRPEGRQEYSETPERGSGSQRPEGANDRSQREAGKERSQSRREGEERTPGGQRGQRPDSLHKSAPQEAGEENAQHSNRQGGQQRGERTAEVDYTVWTKVANSLASSISSYKTISIQNGTATVAINKTGNTSASDRYTFDTRTGEITDVQYYKDLDKSAKIRGWIYAVHVGSWGGMFTSILYFIACLIGASLPLTGYYIYIKKRWKKNKKARV